MVIWRAYGDTISAYLTLSKNCHIFHPTVAVWLDVQWWSCKRYEIVKILKHLRPIGDYIKHENKYHVGLLLVQLGCRKPQLYLLKTYTVKNKKLGNKMDNFDQTNFGFISLCPRTNSLAD